MAAKVVLTLRVEEAMRERLKDEAKKQGVPLSRILDDRLKGGTVLDPEIQHSVEGLAASLGIPEPTIVESIVALYFAEKIAFERVWGTPSRRLLVEFTRTDSGPLTGKALLENLVEMRCAQFERERESSLESQEKWGLSEEDQLWLDARRQRRKQPSVESLRDLPSQSRAVALEALDHHRICSEIERTQGEEAALSYHVAYLERRRKGRKPEDLSDA